MQSGFFNEVKSPKPKAQLELEAILANLNKSLVESMGHSDNPDGSYNSFTPLDPETGKPINEKLSECTCALIRTTFNRVLSDHRERAEKVILDETEKLFESKKKVPLKCLSLGSAGLLQNFIICSKLLLAGYSIDITLIESRDNILFQKAINLFKSLKTVAEEMRLSFKVHQYDNVDSFREDNSTKEIDVAWAIDFDTCWFSIETLCTIYQILQRRGFFCLTVGTSEQPVELIFPKESEPRWFGSQSLSEFPFSLEPDFQHLFLIPSLSTFDEKEANSTTQLYKEKLASHLKQDSIMKKVLAYVGFFELSGIRKTRSNLIDEIEECQLESYKIYEATRRGI